jgi:hypothetical protein
MNAIKKAKKNITNEDLADKMDVLIDAYGYLDTKIERLDLKLSTKIEALEYKIEKEIQLLAEATAKGFEAVDKRFDKVESRLDVVEDRLGIIDGRLTIMGIIYPV